MAKENGLVLVVGATGDLGGRVVDALLVRGRPVKALVRPGSDATKLEQKGVVIARGDLTDPASLDQALQGVDALVTTAAGYVRRKKGDSLASVDDRGNRNLVAAAKRAHIRRFVFTSILTADKAKDVPHFWQKKLIEDELEAQGVPYVALRPGAFMGGAGARFFAKTLQRGKLLAFARPESRFTWIHPDDVARALVLAIDDPRAVNRRIDLGSDRAVSSDELALILGHELGRHVEVGRFMTGAFRFVASAFALVNEMAADMVAMSRYFDTGQYVADTTVQRELFGSVPTVEETARKLIEDIRLEVHEPHPAVG